MLRFGVGENLALHHTPLQPTTHLLYGGALLYVLQLMSRVFPVGTLGVESTAGLVSNRLAPKERREMRMWAAEVA